MAGLGFNANSGEVTLAAGVAKTVLQVKAPANQRVLIRSLRLMGKQPAGGTDTPAKVRLTRSVANFGTGSGVTLAKTNPTNTETLQSSAFSNFTVEPTAPTDGGEWWEVQPQSGVIEYLPRDGPIEIPGGQSAQFEATSVATPTLNFQAKCEE